MGFICLLLLFHCSILPCTIVYFARLRYVMQKRGSVGLPGFCHKFHFGQCAMLFWEDFSNHYFVACCSYPGIWSCAFYVLVMVYPSIVALSGFVSFGVLLFVAFLLHGTVLACCWTPPDRPLVADRRISPDA